MADSLGVKLSKCEQKTSKNIKPFRSLPNVALTWDLTSLTIPWSHGPIPIPTALRGGWTRTWAASVKRAGSVRAVSTRVWAVGRALVTPQRF